MTREQRSITIALCVVVGFTFLISTSLTFLVEPMATDLGLGDGSITTLLAIPAIASLVIIFLAGRAGDRLGHRETLLGLSTVFVVGASIVTLGTNGTIVAIGLALCGGSATAIQIVSLGLLQLAVPDGAAHTSAFTSFGMVYPITLLTFPILSAAMLDRVDWRIIPILWIVAGVLMTAVLWSTIPGLDHRRPLGEWMAPVFAGAALAAGVRFLDAIGREGWSSTEILPDLALLAIATFAFVIRHRRIGHDDIVLEPLRDVALRVLLSGVALVATVATLTYVVLALESMFDLTALEAAIAITPAQLGGIVGAKVIAHRSIERWGYSLAARHLTASLAIAMLTLVIVQPSTPIWVIVACATAFNTAAFAAVTVLNADVMRRAPADDTGPVSSLRGAASAIGSGLGVVLLGSGVIAAVDLHDTTAAERAAEITGALRIDGLVGFAIALVGWALLRLPSMRASQTPALAADDDPTMTS